MSALDLRTIARALGGEISGREVRCPGAGHSGIDRSLSIKLSSSSPLGFVVFSHCGDDFAACKDYVAARLGIGPDAWRRDKTNRVHCPQLVRPRWVDVNVDNINVDKTDHTARIARAVAIWNESHDAHGTIVEAYLASRGLDLNLVDNVNDVLRYHPRCPWRDEAENRTIFVPAMVAAMRSIETDAVTAIHRSRLSHEGVKLDRRMLGIAAGAAVKLDADDAVSGGLHVGEGIETCLAARQLGFRPAWALASAGAIQSFAVQPGIECLTILAENDPTNARAVETCARRWHEAGREVVIVEPKVGSDLNDAMRAA